MNRVIGKSGDRVNGQPKTRKSKVNGRKSETASFELRISTFGWSPDHPITRLPDQKMKENICLQV